MRQRRALEVRGEFQGLDHLGVEKQLLKTPGVTGAAANPASESVTVDFDEQLVTPAALPQAAARRDLQSCAYSNCAVVTLFRGERLGLITSIEIMASCQPPRLVKAPKVSAPFTLIG